MTVIKLSREYGLDADKFARKKIQKICRKAIRYLELPYDVRVEAISWDLLLEGAAYKHGDRLGNWHNYLSSDYLLTLLLESTPYSWTAGKLNISYRNISRIVRSARYKVDDQASMGLGIKLLELVPEAQRNEIVRYLSEAYELNFDQYLFLNLKEFNYV